MKKSYCLAAITIFLWSTTSTVSKLLLKTLNSFQMLLIGALFAAIFLLGYNLVTGTIKKMKKYRLKDFLTMTLIGLPGTFLYYVFFYTGTDKMQASQALIVNYLWPIFSVAFACIILKEKMSLRKGIAFAVSFFGIVIVTWEHLFHFNISVLTGAMFCMLAALFYGLFTALNRMYCYEKTISLMVSYFASAILTAVILYFRGDCFTLNWIQTAGLAWNGVFAIGVANLFWLWALDCGKTAKISNLAYITPFLSLVWTSYFLGDDISLYSVVGLVVIILGIFIQLKDNSSENKR